MLELGVTGPMIRAAGVNFGTRKEKPHIQATKSFGFTVPTRTENDVYARYLVRVEEMRQSSKHHVKQALAGMPEGRFQADAPGTSFCLTAKR